MSQSQSFESKLSALISREKDPQAAMREIRDRMAELQISLEEPGDHERPSRFAAEAATNRDLMSLADQLDLKQAENLADLLDSLENVAAR